RWRPPVFAAGAAGRRARPLRVAPYPGVDGLGALPAWPPVEPRPAPVAAPRVIVDAARRHERGLTIVALGPLTNLALAVEADAAGTPAPGRVLARGGAVDAPATVPPPPRSNADARPLA